ncbi:P27 family phage terminase small subunit [Sutcliffiella horikoshii]|uniref:P27 family phage terminase small subunit n=1 Tax=Sutcliffiella horikoshii TaxID=79883 RepID=A0A5D4TFC5_9BACI|nr:P27 family phage terminase small subunit [Sutcliffiella horikoshii]TYS74510.1 P27 family phage terminase small subunit [Sutcliffiella horikoshii]
MAKTKRSVENEIKRKMKELGTYKKEYDQIVKIYAGMLFQYQVFEEKFEESGYQITEEYTNKAGATNERKVPLLTAMESLRKDIATYSDRLCLNPKSLENVTPEKTKGSKLASVLSNLQ